jgi:hypothetical protein
MLSGMTKQGRVSGDANTPCSRVDQGGGRVSPAMTAADPRRVSRVETMEAIVRLNLRFYNPY